jgi:hypothetical protein
VAYGLYLACVLSPSLHPPPPNDTVHLPRRLVRR